MIMKIPKTDRCSISSMIISIILTALLILSTFTACNIQGGTPTQSQENKKNTDVTSSTLKNNSSEDDIPLENTPPLANSNAGLYKNGTRIKTWQELLDEEVIYVINGVLTTNYNTSSNKNESANVLSGELIVDGSVTALGNNAFHGCNQITKITIPNTVTEIGVAVFENCSKLTYNTYNNSSYIGNTSNPYLILIKTNDKNITSYTVHSTTKIIGDGALANCYSLNSVSLPSGLIQIGANAFHSCGKLKIVSIPKTVQVIGNEAFQGCSNMETLNFAEGSNLKRIEYGAFSYCQALKNVTLPKNLKTIEGWAFAYCKELTNIVISEGVTTIGEQAFGGCEKLTKITIPSTVTEIDDYAFSWCKALRSVTFSSGSQLQYIGTWAFYYCEALTAITIPSNVETIGEEAFYECKALNNISFEGTKDDWNKIFLGSKWNAYTPAKAIKCSDATISLNQ